MKIQLNKIGNQYRLQIQEYSGGLKRSLSFNKGNPITNNIFINRANMYKMTLVRSNKCNTSEDFYLGVNYYLVFEFRTSNNLRHIGHVYLFDTLYKLANMNPENKDYKFITDKMEQDLNDYVDTIVGSDLPKVQGFIDGLSTLDILPNFKKELEGFCNSNDRTYKLNSSDKAHLLTKILTAGRLISYYEDGFRVPFTRAGLGDISLIYDEGFKLAFHDELFREIAVLDEDKNNKPVLTVRYTDTAFPARVYEYYNHTAGNVRAVREEDKENIKTYLTYSELSTEEKNEKYGELMNYIVDRILKGGPYV